MASISFQNEGDVVQYVKSAIERSTGARFQNISSQKGESYKAWRTDGLIEWGDVKLLFEAKFGTDLTSSAVRSRVIGQALYYCKRFESRGDGLPNVILIADDKHFFCIPFTAVNAYLNADIDWSLPPSSPDTRLIVDNIAILWSDIQTFNGEQIKEECESIALSGVYKVRPTPHNISEMFTYWVDHIFPKNSPLSSVDKIDVMFSCIFYEEGLHVDTSRYENNVIMVKNKKGSFDPVSINGRAYGGFFSKRQRGLHIREIDALNAMRDRIIEDDTRRRQGAFFTPTLWVDEAHKEISKVLGDKWRDECVVWDCCAGTANLTRDYTFSNLIISTAEAADIDAIHREGYNANAHIFQYDFLRPNTDSLPFEIENNIIPFKVIAHLEKCALEGKRIVFFMNPPYAEDGVAGAKGDSKKDVADTLVSRQMPRLGRANRQLYAQFLYQAEQLASQFGFTKKTIAVFSPTLFMMSGSFEGFRSYFYDRYAYQTGFMFQASHFADVVGSWGIGFTLWSEGKTDKTQDLPMTLKDKSLDQIVDVGMKDMYCSDGKEASEWVSALAPKSSSTDTPKFSSGLSIKEVEGNNRGIAPNSLGIMCNMGNNLVDSATGVLLISGKPTHKGRCNHDMTEGEGWRRSIALYSARKLVDSTWATQKDEYLAPNTQSEGYEQWVDDCHIYALLHTSNNMTAMRDVEYKGKKWNIHNNFFWMTRAAAIELYSANGAHGPYRDARSNAIPYVSNDDGSPVATWRQNGDPYFAHTLPSLTLSPLALEIMSDLKALFIATLPLRSRTSSIFEGNTEINLHLSSWDAGIYQHNKLWKTDSVLNVQWEAIKAKHKELGRRLEDGVYTYGFLRK